MDFTEQEVKDKLEELGYHDVPHSKLLQFIADLDNLIQLDLSGVTSTNEDVSYTDNDDLDNTLPLQDITMKSQPKAFAKEKLKLQWIIFHLIKKICLFLTLLGTLTVSLQHRLVM